MATLAIVAIAVAILFAMDRPPIIVCPCGSQKAFHPEGEIATARAARAKGHLQLLSGVSTTSPLSS